MGGSNVQGERMSELTKERMEEELAKKLQVIRLDLLTKGWCSVDREFFWVAVPSGQTLSEKESYKEIDLAKEFQDDILEFAKRHNVKAISTSKGYIFE